MVKDQSAIAAIHGLAEQLGTKIFIQSTDHKLTLGEQLIDPSFQADLLISADRVATFCADQKAGGEQLLAIINLLLKKELEKKQIGAEVLSLYREINMIYDFSEKISEKIDTSSIAKIALEEASQIIRCTDGSFLIYDAIGDRISEVSGFGKHRTAPGHIDRSNALLKSLITKGTSAIVPEEILRKYQSLTHLKSLMYAPLKVKHRNLGLIMLGQNSDKEFTAAELKLLTTIALQSASAIESATLYEEGLRAAQEREDAIRKIHQVSTKFVPFEFIRSLGKTNLTQVNLGDQVEREVTVLFADIREFTSLSEDLSPAENFLFVNGFNKRMGPIIRRNHGFINQYLGDGFMAIFPDGSQNALLASVEMHKALGDYNQERSGKGRSPIRIGIGMQMGRLIMGITGDNERMDAAIISDTVNTAARIESLSKHYGTSILLTEDCLQQLDQDDAFDFRYLGLVQIKGKQTPLKIFECINGDSEDLYRHKIETMPVFDAGMDQFFAKEFAMAAVTFQQIVKKHKDDTTAKLLLNRAAHLITQEVGDDWQGIEMMQRK